MWQTTSIFTVGAWQLRQVHKIIWMNHIPLSILFKGVFPMHVIFFTISIASLLDNNVALLLTAFPSTRSAENKTLSLSVPSRRSLFLPPESIRNVFPYFCYVLWPI